VRGGENDRTGRRSGAQEIEGEAVAELDIGEDEVGRGFAGEPGGGGTHAVGGAGDEGIGGRFRQQSADTRERGGFVFEDQNAERHGREKRERRKAKGGKTGNAGNGGTGGTGMRGEGCVVRRVRCGREKRRMGPLMDFAQGAKLGSGAPADRLRGKRGRG